MNKLLKLLIGRLGFIFPMVGEVDDSVGDPPSDEPEIEASDDDLGDDPTPEDDEIPEDPALEARPARRSDDVRSRVEAAERRAEEALRKAEALSNPSPSQTQEDRIRADEDRRLNSPDTSEMEKWQIQANRALRQSQEQSRQALFQAQDMADQTAYQAKALKNPTYAKFSDKVESELKKARAQGQNIPRELILQVLVGRAVLEGKRKSPATPSPSRGKPNAARSDVPARSSMSDKQKRAARLQNQQI